MAQPTEARPEVYEGRPPEMRWNSMMDKLKMIEAMWSNLKEEIDRKPNYECVPELQDILARVDLNMDFGEGIRALSRYWMLNGGIDGIRVPMKEHQAIYKSRT